MTRGEMRAYEMPGMRLDLTIATVPASGEERGRLRPRVSFGILALFKVTNRLVTLLPQTGTTSLEHTLGGAYAERGGGGDSL